MYAGLPVRYVQDVQRYKLTTEQLNNLNQIGIVLPKEELCRYKGLVSVTSKSGKYFKLKELNNHIHKKLAESPKIWNSDALVSYLLPNQFLIKIREQELFIRQSFPLIYNYATLYIKFQNETRTNKRV